MFLFVLIPACVLFIGFAIMGACIVISIFKVTCITAGKDDEIKLPIYVAILLYIISLAFNVQFLFGLIINILSILNFTIHVSLYLPIYISYAVGRCGIVSLFVSKLHYSFIGSYLQISFYKLLVISILSSIGLICVIIGLVLYFLLETLVVLALAGMYGVIDIITNIIMVRMFVTRLKQLKSHSIIDDSNQVYTSLIKKHILLSIITILSTFIVVVISAVIYKVDIGSDTAIIWRIGYAIDAAINMICVYLSMGFTKNKYKKYCRSFEQFLVR